MPHLRNSTALLLAFLILIVMCAALYVKNVGVRGSDQYWYLADTQTLIQNREPVTNTVFPGFLLRDPVDTSPTPFLHNGPALHVNAFLGKMLGAFTAWKISNIALYALAALLTGLAAHKLVGRNYAALAIALYAIAPVTIWQAGNLLMETFLTAISAAIFCITLYAHNKKWVGWALVPLCFVGALSHPMFVILAALYSIYSLLRKQFLLSFSIICTVMVAMSMAGTWFPSSFQPSLEILITSTIPAKTNMLWQLSDTTIPFDLELLLLKSVDALRMQFAVPQLAPFYITTNLGGLALLWLLCTRFRQLGFYLLVSFVFYGLYVGMAVLMQNQPRYQLLITPVAVSAIVLVLSQLRIKKAAGAILLIGCVGLVLVDGLLIKRLNTGAKAEAANMAQLIADTDFIGIDKRVAILGSEVSKHASTVFALQPRPSLLIQTDLLSEGKIEQTLTTFKANFIISDEPLANGIYGTKLLKHTADVGHLNKLYVYQRSGQ